MINKQASFSPESRNFTEVDQKNKLRSSATHKPGGGSSTKEEET